MGHDIQACRALELMKERTSDLYIVQGEVQPNAQTFAQGNFQPARNNQAPQQYSPNCREFENQGKWYSRGSDRPPIFYNCGEQRHIQTLCTKPHILCGYC